MTRINQILRQWLPLHHLQRHKEQIVENNNQVPVMYTEEQLMARLKFFIGICLSLTLFGIVFVVLYSLIFVTQPLNAISPIDSKFFELIIPIATFLTGTLSGIMLAGGDKDAQKQALQAANAGWSRPPTPPAPSGGFGNGNTTAPATGFASGSTAFGATAAGGFGSSTSGFGSNSTVGAGASGFGGGGFGSAPSTTGFGATVTPTAGVPQMGKPAPSRPPLDENLPPLD
jgi:hypothetical protein